VSVKILLTFDAADEDLERIRAASDSVAVDRAERRGQALELAADAEVVLAGNWWEALWKAAPRLRWVQSWGAGVERFLTPGFVASPIVLTNARGIYSVPIAEHVMAFVLSFTRGFHELIRNQLGHRWRYDIQPRELIGKTMGIVGMGGIGTELAKRAQVCGMRVIAVRRRAGLPAPYADDVRGPESLGWLLAESDYVALCAALTRQTRHLIGEEALRQMKPTAYLINIARGGLVDEAALVSALEERRIAGAGLDVFETEPLPDDSPLWDLPNVLITPHCAGSSLHSHRRLMDLFCENLRRYLAGEELLNVVNKQDGY